MKSSKKSALRTEKTDEQDPLFRKVGECLYRHTSGKYYALVKRGGKQFRRSLKTKDRKLAERKLSELRRQVGALRIDEDRNSDFETLAKHWLALRQHGLSKSTVSLQLYFIKNLMPYFSPYTFRHLFATTCIEAGVDIPTIAKWMGHKDGGALAMKTYGHLRTQHSDSQATKVSFGVPPAPPQAPAPREQKAGDRKIIPMAARSALEGLTGKAGQVDQDT